jgi:hypothetical protein
VDRAKAVRARSLAPLVKARGFGMTRAEGMAGWDGVKGLRARSLAPLVKARGFGMTRGRRGWIGRRQCARDPSPRW